MLGKDRIMLRIFFLKVKNRVYKDMVYYFWMFYYCFSNAKYGINSEKRKRKIYISLTSFTPRLKLLHLCLKSLLNQDMKPDGILLYLGEDVDSENLPKKINKLKKYGIEIITDCENIKPHKKYFYAMQKYSKDIIITVDDDVIYPKDLVSSLFDEYINHPESVICRRARKIKQDDGRELSPYYSWSSIMEHTGEPSLDLLAIGIDGVLYPPNCLDERVFDVDVFKEHCLNADDIWLKFMAIMKRTPVICIDRSYKNTLVIRSSQKSALKHSNVEKSQNDNYILALEKYFNVSLNDLIFNTKNME